MILSIVRCSYYKKNTQAQSVKETEVLGNGVEVIGPIIGPNISAMRNYGARKAKGQWILFVDHDCNYSIEKTLKILSVIKNSSNNFGAFSGVYKQATNSYFQKSYDRIQRLWVLKGLHKESRRPLRKANHLLGGCLVVKKSIWQEAQGFDESIGWGGEETEFVQRIQKLGYETGIAYSLRTKHRCDIGFFGFLKRAWVQNFNRGFYDIKIFQKEKTYKVKKIASIGVIGASALVLFVSVSMVGFWSGIAASMMTKS